MASGGQQSSAQATAKGVTALQAAQDGVARCRRDVDSTRNDLARGYQGSDGAEFGKLLAKWDEQCSVIQKNLGEMIEALQQSMVQHGKVQTASTEAVRQASQASDAVFQTLTGS